GSAGCGLLPQLTIARSLPVLMYGYVVPGAPAEICECPPRACVRAGPPPVVGRWRSLILAASMNIAWGVCVMPYGPDDENTSSFGFDLASSTNCFTLCTGREGWTTMMSGSAAKRASGTIWSSE